MMNTKNGTTLLKIFSSLLCISLLVACAPIHVSYDYEMGTDFNKYKTYNMFPEIQTGLSELDTGRLLNAIDSVLQSKGFMVSDTPDFYVNVSSSEFQVNRGNTVGVGVGGTGRNIGGGVSIGIPVGTSNIDKQIVLDFIDVDKDILFWQVVTESAFSPRMSPKRRDQKIKAIVTKAFSKYPPEK